MPPTNVSSTSSTTEPAADLAELRDRPVFICGHPKSGTSLVRALLDSHPQLVVYPEESLFFRRYLPRSTGMDLESRLDLADRTLIHIFRWNKDKPVPDQQDFPGRDYSALPFEAVRGALRRLASAQDRHPGDMLSAAVLAYGEVSGEAGPGARAWVEKSPYNEYYAAQIFAWWPEARCVHIVRDPRDNFASYRRKHPEWAPEFFASNWSRSTQAGYENQRRFGPERYLILSYEDLVQSPEETLQRLAGYVGIDWDAALSTPTRAGVQWQGNSMFAERFKQVSDAPVGRWKGQLTPLEAGVIELMASRALRSAGYEAEALAEGNTVRLRARLRALAWPVRRRLLRKKTA